MADEFKPSTTIDPATFNAITLDDIRRTMVGVLTELRNEADKGEKWFYDGTATPTLKVYDFSKDPPYHAVKGYIIHNDGTNTIEFTHNRNDNFDTLKPNESIPISYNRGAITKFFLRSVGGNSAYRLWFLW